MPELRQKLLILYCRTPDLNSEVGAWAVYDATGREIHTTGDSDTPPYRSVFAAMKDGWRVIQLPQQFPAYPGMELSTSYLRWEYILEKLEEVRDGVQEASAHIGPDGKLRSGWAAPVRRTGPRRDQHRGETGD